MAFNVFWVIPNRVFCVEYTRDLVLDDIGQSTVTIADYLVEAYTTYPDKIVVGIIDLRDTRLDSIVRLAINVATNQIIKVIDPRIWQARKGFSVLITSSERARLVISFIHKFNEQPMTTVASREEALMVLRSMYPDLDDAIADVIVRRTFADTGTPDEVSGSSH